MVLKIFMHWKKPSDSLRSSGGISSFCFIKLSAINDHFHVSFCPLPFETLLNESSWKRSKYSVHEHPVAASAQESKGRSVLLCKTQVFTLSGDPKNFMLLLLGNQKSKAENHGKIKQSQCKSILELRNPWDTSIWLEGSEQTDLSGFYLRR